MRAKRPRRREVRSSDAVVTRKGRRQGGALADRKNQAKLSAQEWDRFVTAVKALHGMVLQPSYRAFVSVHVQAMSSAGMDWGVHTMAMGGMRMKGRNFLAWHRQYLARFEKRLQQVDATVTIPYWDWAADRTIPAPLAAPQLVQELGITRGPWRPDLLPHQDDINAVLTNTRFDPFQTMLESIHNDVHNAVGGNMASAASPADPLFWLHHSNIDRIWDEWQRAHNGPPPDNVNEVLQPPPLFGVEVGSVVSASDLDYRYV